MTNPDHIVSLCIQSAGCGVFQLKRRQKFSAFGFERLIIMIGMICSFHSLVKRSRTSLGRSPGSEFIYDTSSPWYTFSNACWKSALMSSMCSIPTDTRSKVGNTPAEIFSSSDSCWCVVAAGWMINVFESPKFSRWLTNLRLSTTLVVCCCEPLRVKERTAPNPLRKYFLASLW